MVDFSKYLKKNLTPELEKELQERKEKTMSDLAKYLKKREQSSKKQGDRIKLEYLKLIIGSNYLRFLPLKDSDMFCFEVRTHVFYDKAGVQIYAKCLSDVDQFDDYGNPPEETDCYPCLGFNALMAETIDTYKTKDDPYAAKNDEAKAKKKEIREHYGTKQNYVGFVVTPRDQNPENRKKVRLFQFGPDTFNPLLTLRSDQEECGDFTDRYTGRELIISKVVKGKKISDTSYSIQKAESGKQELKDWDEIYAQVPEDSKSVLFMLSAENLEKLFTGEVSQEELFKKKETAQEEAQEAEPKKVPASKTEPSKQAKTSTPAPVKEEPKPGCYQSAEDHDPKDQICKDCPYFVPCGNAPEVKAKQALLARKISPTASIEEKKAALQAIAKK